MRRPLPALRLVAWAWLVLAAAPQAQLDLRSCRSDYRIEVSVEPALKGLTGQEWITWENRSGDAVSDLWLHLYLNAFSNDRSTHLTESKGLLRGHEIKEGWGWQRITGIWVARPGQAEVDVLDTLHYRQPDDDNAEDRSVISADLPWPVGPGETLEVRITWDSRLPRVRRRTGIKGDFIFAAQWFPKLGVYEGGRGWNCHQFHMNSEFYADYGTYDVSIDLPAEYEGKVGGSGVVAESRRQSDRVVTRFLAPSPDDREREDVGARSPRIHDFAWTADPDYVEVVRTFKFREWAQRYREEVDRVAAALGRPSDSLIGRNVDVRLLIQPEHAGQAERHIEATMAALFFYGLWWGPYPYEQVTVVDPAWGARAAGGMEYPTLFTAGTRLFTRPSMHSPESVTVHECGHQFWYGLVGNNEFEAAWLDEGFNSYTDSEVLFRHYGPQAATTDYARLPVPGTRLAPAGGGAGVLSALSGRGWHLPWTGVTVSPLDLGGLVDFWRDQPALTLARQTTDPRAADRRGYLADPDRDPIDTCAWCYVDRLSYRTNSYPRTAVALRSLSGLVGRDAFLRGMRHYSETWRYRHPYPDDFFEAFLEGSGQKVAWYFDEVFRGTGTADWKVSVERRVVPPPKGWFQAEPAAEFVLREENEKPAGEGAGEAGEPPAGPPAGAGERPAAAEGDAQAGQAPAPGQEPAGEPAAPDSGAGSNPDSSPDSNPDSNGGEDVWRTEIILSRSGELALPMDVLIVYEDGSREQLEWTRAEQLERRWRRIVRTGANEVVAVRLDPERRYWLDSDMSNDSWFAESDSVAPLRWSERVFSQVSQYLHWMSVVGG